MGSIFLDEKFAVLIALAVSVFITWFSIPIVVRVATMRNLTDLPGKRKIHKREIPTLGGIAIFAGFSTSFLMSIDGFMQGVNYFTFALLLLFFIGMKDDLIPVDPKKKLFAEILAAICLIYFTDIRITNFHGFMGVQEIPVWLTYISTIFLMIVIINAVNLSDGIDGLAASIGIVASATFGVWFFLSGNTGYTIMAAALTGTLIAFLRYNLSSGKDKIFMGDTGSLIIGFLIAAMTIRFNEVNATASTYHDLYSAPAISIAILIVPLFDTLRVFTIRLMRGQHPFIADNRHIHHLMLRTGSSHKRSSFIISIAHIFIIALAFSLDHIGIFRLALILLMVCLLLTGVIYLLVYRRYLMKHRSLNGDDMGTLRVILYIHKLFRQRKTVRVPDLTVSSEIPRLVANIQ
jgi:UDP-N-acetylmuramyl pentapeptide phosphotransferase/UDP-N-acetylglucosamine-1-phosphate transferase